MSGMGQHMDMLQQLRRSYANNEEELDNARRITELHDEVAQLCQQDERRITDIIRGMQEEVREAEAAAAPPDPALHERQVADLQAACRDSLSRIASLENEARDLQEQQGELRERQRGAETSAAATSRHIRQTDPKLRNELSLFANISKIAWKYGDSGVTGTVSDRQRKDLRPFNFDPAAMSDFEMANKLWEVIA